MTAPTPREQALEMLSLHGSSSWSEDARGMICDGCSTRIQGVGLPRHQIEILAAAGLLPDREEWGVLYEADRDLVIYDAMDSEAEACKAVADSPTDTTLVHRYTTTWRTA